MSKKATPEEIKQQIVTRSLSMLLGRLNTSKKNEKALSALLETIETDVELSATEKKRLLGKINSYFVVSTEDLLTIVNELSAHEGENTLSEKICVAMTDEVQKWAM